MNVQCKHQGKSVLVRTDDGDRSLPNFENIMDVLKDENLLELLNFYYERDLARYNELVEYRELVRSTGVKLALGVTSATVFSFLLSGTDIMSEDMAKSIGIGALITTASYAFLGKISQNQKELLGLRECLKYQEERMSRLNTKLMSAYLSGKIVDSDESVELVDDRVAKDNLNKVLEFIFYMGCNRNKVRNLVKKLRLHSFVRKEFKINDLDSLIEIENYVYRTFSSEFNKATGYVIK